MNSPRAPAKHAIFVGECAPAPPPPRLGSHPARRVARCPHRPGDTAYVCTASLSCPAALRPFSHHSTLGLPLVGAALGPTLPASSYITPYARRLTHPPAQHIWPKCSPRGGRSVHRHVYPCVEVSMAHPLLRAHQSPRVLKPGRGCRKSTPPCDVPLLCLPVGAVPAEQLLDLLDVGEEVRDQISPHLGGHRCVVRPLVHLGW